MGKNQKERHVSGESTMSTDSSYIPTPPDGGWGWVVCFASFINHIIVDGISFTFGVFYIEFLDYFKESKGKTALVGSLLCGCYLMTGPIASALTNKFGCRPVCIAGAIIACAAFLLSTLSTCINHLIITYGIMGGIGFGLIYLPSVISVSYYFERRRAMATGIAVCGAGVGTFLFAPVGRFLLDSMDWKSAMLIIAGIVLNGVVCGALMRPLEPPKRFRKPRAKNFLDRLKERAVDKINSSKKRTRQESECSVCTGAGRGHHDIMQKVQEAKLAREQALHDEDSESEMSSIPSLSVHSLKRAGRSRDNSIHVIKEVSSDELEKLHAATLNGNIPTIVVDEQTEKKPLVNGKVGASEDTNRQQRTMSESKSVTFQNGSAKAVEDVPNGCATLPSRSKGKGALPPQINRLKAEEKANLIPNGDNSLCLPANNIKTSISVTDMWVNQNRLRNKRPPGVAKEDYSRPMYRQDIFYSGSILQIPQFRSQPDCRSYVKSITTIPGEYPEDESTRCMCIPKSARDTLLAMLDITIFKDPVFLIACIANVFGMLGMYTPFIYLPEKAMKAGSSAQQASFLLSVIGITNTVGRVLAGVLADMPKVNALLLHNIAIVMGGASCLSVYFLNTYAALCSFAAIFGMCVATWISLTSIILCNLMGLEKLTNAFGMLTLTRGVAVIAGPPIAGMMHEMTGSLDSSFFIGGAMLLLAGFSSFILHLPYFSRRQKKLQEAAQPDVLSTDQVIASLEEEERMLKEFQQMVSEIPDAEVKSQEMKDLKGAKSTEQSVV